MHVGNTLENLNKKNLLILILEIKIQNFGLILTPYMYILDRATALKNSVSILYEDNCMRNIKKNPSRFAAG